MMPANIAGHAPEPFPQRGVPGGWKDRWDVDYAAEARTQAEAMQRRDQLQAMMIGGDWRDENAAGQDVAAGQERTAGEL